MIEKELAHIGSDKVREIVVRNLKEDRRGKAGFPLLRKVTGVSFFLSPVSMAERASLNHLIP